MGDVSALPAGGRRPRLVSRRLDSAPRRQLSRGLGGRRLPLLDHRPGPAVGHAADQGRGSPGGGLSRRPALRSASPGAPAAGLARRAGRLWCLWPAVAAAFAAEPRPAPLLADRLPRGSVGIALAARPPLLRIGRRPAPARQGPGAVGAGLPAVQPGRRRARAGRLRRGVRDASVSRRRRRPLPRLQADRLLRARQPVRPVDLAQRVGGAVAGDLVARRALALGGSDPGGDGAGRAVGRRRSRCWRSARPACGRSAGSGRGCWRRARRC